MPISPQTIPTRQRWRARAIALLTAPAFVACALFASVSAFGQTATPTTEAATAQPRIAFVHLRFTADQVQLVDVRIVPGQFKPAPEPASERIALQVVGSSGKVLWQGWTEDPRTRVLEYERGNDRRLNGRAISVPTADTSVRVPFIEEGQTIRISRISPVPNAAATEKQLGTIQIRER
jgi:hypothetical protein